MSKKKTEEWCEAYGISIVGKIMEHLDKETNGDKDVYKYAIHHLIRFLVGGSVLAMLKEKDPRNKTAKEAFEYTSQNLREMKGLIQDGVSSGYAKALEAFSGEPSECICRIEMVKKPKNNGGSDTWH